LRFFRVDLHQVIEHLSDARAPSQTDRETTLPGLSIDFPATACHGIQIA